LAQDGVNAQEREKRSATAGADLGKPAGHVEEHKAWIVAQVKLRPEIPQPHNYYEQIAFKKIGLGLPQVLSSQAFPLP
jgi:hypothetical protein